jgi:hypothetical protein
MQLKDTVIYGLFDATGIRYVGKTCMPIHKRLLSHVATAALNYNSHKNNWIKKLLASGIRPEIRVLETIPAAQSQNWPAREQAWISFGRRIGWNLTNGSSGGDAGGRGKQHSEETKRKMSKARKRFLCEHPEHLKLIAPKPGRYSPETIKRMSETQKACWDNAARRAALSANMKGKPKSEAHKQKMAEIKSLWANDEVVKEKLREYGRLGAAKRWGDNK